MINVFQTSNVSTRALMNSPWDPISAGSSRRSSLATGGGAHNTGNIETPVGTTPAISQHLGRLRKKAQNLQQEHQLQSLTPNAAQSENLRNMSGRASAMSDCSLPASATQLHNTHLQQMQNMQHSYSNIPNQGHSRTPNQWNNNVQYPQPQYQQAQQNGQGPRRASDPVRALDRNFGVTPSHNHPQGQLNSRQKTGSFQNIDNSQMNQRLPLHGQRIRGMSGDSHFVNQPMPNNGITNQVSHQPNFVV